MDAMKPKLKTRLRECAEIFRSMAKQIVSPQHVHREMMERAETCDAAVEELERFDAVMPAKTQLTLSALLSSKAR